MVVNKGFLGQEEAGFLREASLENGKNVLKFDRAKVTLGEYAKITRMLSWFAVCGSDSHGALKQLGERFHLIPPGHAASLREGRAGTQARTSKKEKMLLTGLLSGLPHSSCSDSFAMQSRSSCIGTAPPIVGCALPRQLAIKIYP